MEYVKLNIKPLSVNQVWRGRRFKTDLYKIYERELFFMLPSKIEFKKPYKFALTFGFSSKSADIDNPVKPFIDVLQKKYNINDKDIFELRLKKEIVKKGDEYIKLEIL